MEVKVKVARDRNNVDDHAQYNEFIISKISYINQFAQQ